MHRQAQTVSHPDQEKLLTTIFPDFLQMDHYGLVAAFCKDLKLAERIDKRLSINSQRKVKAQVKA
jgi:hypothetical protein